MCFQERERKSLFLKETHTEYSEEKSWVWSISCSVQKHSDWKLKVSHCYYECIGAEWCKRFQQHRNCDEECAESAWKDVKHSHLTFLSIDWCSKEWVRLTSHNELNTGSVCQWNNDETAYWDFTYTAEVVL